MLSSTHIEPLLLGEMLIKQGVTTSDQIEIAMTEQKKGHEQLSAILVRLGFATESIIRDVIGGVIGQESINLEHVIPESEALSCLSKEDAHQLHILPLTYNRDRNALSIAMVNTLDVVLLDKISAHVEPGIQIIPLLASETEIEKAIDLFYGFELSVDGILNEIETGEIDYKSLQSSADEYSQPVVRLVNALLSDAVKRSASDIHLEPEEGFLRFRYRIDGVLRQIRSLHNSYWSAIAVRVKIMAGMDIAEMRAPQDGRISLVFSGRAVDFRVSTFPTIHGENIVLRILDRHKGIVSLEKLGINNDAIDSLRFMIARPAGMILVAGPTGSGKTTTLYSILQYLNTESVNIMTLEDPVEYPTSLIRQTSINEVTKLDFASGIRSLMRQDPDIILVGEIRDQDTASMALRAAMTGHQVFATLHSNSAIGAIPRLIDIGAKLELLTGNLIGIIAQRLIRKLCVQCRQRYAIGDLDRALLDLPADHMQSTIYQAKGCHLCDGTGYKGRQALAEVLAFSSDIDALLARNASASELLQTAVANGFKTLAEIASDCVFEGVSSLAEITRVIDLSTRLKKI